MLPFDDFGHGFRELTTKLLSDLLQLHYSRLLARLRKNRPDDRRYHRLRRLRYLAQDIAHEVNTATLDGAQNDVPLVLQLELLQAFRKVYWNFLHNYHRHVELDMEGVFQLGIKTNFMLDHYIFHYFSSYIEYKDELLRSHRETIDVLSVPIIPLSASMAVLPIVGTLDTYRAKKVQERTLNQIASLKIRKRLTPKQLYNKPWRSINKPEFRIRGALDSLL